MGKIVEIKEDGEVQEEITVETSTDFSGLKFTETDIDREVAAINKEIEDKEKKLAEYNSEIDRLTYQGDGIDLALAATSGVVTGLIDIFFVGEWNFADSKKAANKEINAKVIKFAKKHPDYYSYCKKHGLDEDRLYSAVKFLEEKYPLPGDNNYNLKQNFINFAKEHGFKPSSGKGTYEEALQWMNEHCPRKGKPWSEIVNVMSTKSHHLDDFCHHPTLVGLICCIIVQFTGKSIYVDQNSQLYRIPIVVNQYYQLEGKTPIAKLFAGIINWFFNAANAIANQRGHLMSDIAGSSGSVRKVSAGTGVPGSFLSTLKELSTIKILQERGPLKAIFNSQNLQKAFQHGLGTGNGQFDLSNLTSNPKLKDFCGAFNNLFAGANSRFDARTELAVKKELQRQSIPVILNEALVRSAFFIRRFIDEARERKTIADFQWEKIIPFRNRTVVRMMTVASGTFTAMDLSDAAINGIKKSAGVPAAFWSNLIIKVNFPGMGRFAFAVVTDAGMGIKRNITVSERAGTINALTNLYNSKLFFHQAEIQLIIGTLYEKQEELYKKEQEVWKQVNNTDEAMSELYDSVKQTFIIYSNAISEIDGDLDEISKSVPLLEEKNPGLREELLRRLSG